MDASKNKMKLLNGRIRYCANIGYPLFLKYLTGGPPFINGAILTHFTVYHVHMTQNTTSLATMVAWIVMGVGGNKLQKLWNRHKTIFPLIYHNFTSRSSVAPIRVSFAPSFDTFWIPWVCLNLGLESLGVALGLRSALRAALPPLMKLALDRFGCAFFQLVYL